MGAEIVDVSLLTRVALACHVAIWATVVYVGIVVAVWRFVAPISVIRY